MVQVRPDETSAPAGGLDLHEGLSDAAPHELPGLDGRYPDPRRGGCPRWPEGLWLLSTHGERVPGRCKATNQCDYCARLAAVENSEMLALDAMEGDAPQVWAVLTTRTATDDMTRFYDARELVMRALRRQFPRARYACLLEFTTGYGPRSGGLRRPHWNLLLKGIPAAAARRARQIVVRTWCRNVDAAPSGQYVGAIAEVGGLMRYIALHFQKESQAPPAGFRGQRFNCSRDYFTGRTRAEAREDARLALSEKRALWKLGQHTGLTGDALEDAYEAQLAAEGFPEWRLYSDPREEVNDDEPNDELQRRAAVPAAARPPGGQPPEQARSETRRPSAPPAGGPPRLVAGTESQRPEGPPPARAGVAPPPADPPPLASPAATRRADPPSSVTLAAAVPTRGWPIEPARQVEHAGRSARSRLPR